MPRRTPQSPAAKPRSATNRFPQIQNLPLHHPAIVEPPILDDVPIDVRLAVFFASGLAQEHDGTNLDP